MPWIAAATAAASLASSAMSADSARNQQDEANKAAGTARRVWGEVKAPDLKELLFNQYAQQENLSPSTETAEQLAMQDQLQNVQTDPRLRNAQMSALETMQQIGQGGFTPEQRSQLQSMRQQTEADNTSRLQQLLQQQDARGVGSSDMGLSMRALEAQSAANRQATNVSNTAATGFKQALDAMNSSGQMAGQMENTQYNQQSALAAALRAREAQNFQQRADVQQRNIGAQNVAQQFNLQQKQDISNRNTDIKNQNQMYNDNQRLQQMFANDATIAGGKTGANQAAANTYSANAANTAAAGATTAKGLGELGVGMASLYTKK